jgi:hypothetical protein
LNGVGKTTLSNFLYDKNNPKFQSCSIAVPDDELLLVYNSSFIQQVFYEKPNLNGIFTLSKENKTAEENIKKANEGIGKSELSKKEKKDIDGSLFVSMSTLKQKATEKTWEIKTKYTGGDRVLEYCLENLKGNKETLFEYIKNI